MAEFITNIKNDYTKPNEIEKKSEFISSYKIQNYNIIISNETRNPQTQHKSRLIQDE